MADPVTLMTEVLGVRAMLGSPLNQAPSFQEIQREIEAEYIAITNATNATGNAWQVDTYTLTTVAGQYQYVISDLSTNAQFRFYKALTVLTVPADVDSAPEYVLEFVELEHMPQEWAWLSQNHGQYFASSHDSQMIAFYRAIEDDGAKLYVELRPVPSRAQDYKIIYQQQDWWDYIYSTEEAAQIEAMLPFNSQKFYLRALVAKNLLMQGRVKWSMDPAYNASKARMILEGLNDRIDRGEESYREFISSLDNPDITYVQAWADEAFFE
jgi:hypothetical protein